MERQTNRRSYESYVEGTAVRKTSYAQQEAEPRTYVDNERVTISKSVYRNRAKAAYMTLSYVAVLMVCCITVLVTAVNYMDLRRSVSARKKSMVSLESDINSMKSRNDAIDYSIKSYIDIDNIVKVATEELGMVRPTSDQVSFYESSQYEYMKQFQDVPVE